MSRDLAAQSPREQLHQAAQRGDLAQGDEFLQRSYPINRFDALGKTPPHYAVREGHRDVIDKLIQSGADVNAKDERIIGNTPLSDNIEGCSLEVAKRLIDAGSDPTIRGWMQLNALDRAIKRKDIEGQKIVHLLKAAAHRRRK